MLPKKKCVSGVGGEKSKSPTKKKKKTTYELTEPTPTL